MKRLVIALLLLAAPLAAADTVIFTETCLSNPTVELTSSTTVTVGTGWGSKLALVGSTVRVIQTSSSVGWCRGSAGAADVGIGYIASPNPTTDIYYADFVWTDGGSPTSVNTEGFLVNYIDTSNYYACTISDDATTGATRIVKVSGGVGSALATGTQGTVPTNKVVRCKIDYSGANPTITFTNVTDATEFLSATDSSSPLTKTNAAGAMVGATPQTSTDDIATTPNFITFRVVEVSAAAAGRPRPPWFGRAF